MSEAPKTTPTKPQSEQPYTARGRPLEQKFFDSRIKKRELQIKDPTVPVQGRNRANSLRRLQVPMLESLVKGKNEVSEAAQRELDVRTEMVALSTQQFPENAKPKMASKGPISMTEATALRFSASLAEEAQDELNAQSSGKKQTVGLIGIANVGGTLGMGFSGRKDEEPFMQDVQGRMLELQQHYQQADSTTGWSSQLVPVQTPGFSDLGNVCAASRANLAARSANGEFANMENIGRADLPTPDTLVEMTTRATHPTGGRLKQYEAQPLDTADYPSQYQVQPMQTRNRNGSIANMADSCPTCMEERARHTP
ncbi:hypothetical protein [Gynuella sunshinyii]|uniref:Uncharacterized protein n=1 Tax=Gynuella sunshinyii YC6258 TaxID=1445510 RepID=A0A0C5W4G1_9GAMM|nr:hypothetical protein [Gynuella sunshinyii]AJQ97509.1 hypothetical Protein YC6258_05481 [Gynuella sunshinyii YC6258]